jgi:hypothetical protein
MAAKYPDAERTELFQEIAAAWKVLPEAEKAQLRAVCAAEFEAWKLKHDLPPAI